VEDSLRPRAPTALAVAGLAALCGALYLLLHLIQQSLLASNITTPARGAPSAWDDPSNTPRLLLLLGGFAAVVTALLALYDLLLRWSRRDGWSRTAIRLALGLPITLYVGLWFTAPYFSTDLLTYVANGYIATLPGGNPYAQAADTIAETAFGRELATLGWHGGPLSPYGPIWTAVSTAAVWLSADALTAVWIIKGVAVAALPGSAAAGWWLLGTAAISHRLTGTLAILWNPALAILLVAEGHNDALLMFLIVLSLALTVRQQVIAGWLAQTAAILTKYLSIVLLPLQVSFWWRTRESHGALIGRLLVASAIGLVVAVLLYRPYWIGIDTFFGTGVLGTGQPDDRRFDLVGAALLLGRPGLVGLAIVAGIWRSSTPARLLEACAGVTLVALALGPQRFMPWYASVPIALIALTPGLPWRWLLLVLSACVLLASPILALPIGGDGPISFGLQIWILRVARFLPLVALAAILATRTMWAYGSNRRSAG
jgi:hypothetical protein